MADLTQQLPYNLTYLETPQYHMRCNIGDIKYDEVANTISMSYDGIRSFVDWADFKYVNGELFLELDERMFMGNNVIFTNTTKQLSFLYTKNAEEQQAYDFFSQSNLSIRIGDLVFSLVHTPGQYYFTYRIEDVFIVQNDTPVMPPGLIDIPTQPDTKFDISYIDPNTGKVIRSGDKTI